MLINITKFLSVFGLGFVVFPRIPMWQISCRLRAALIFLKDEEEKEEEEEEE